MLQFRSTLSLALSLPRIAVLLAGAALAWASYGDAAAAWWRDRALAAAVLNQPPLAIPPRLAADPTLAVINAEVPLAEGTVPAVEMPAIAAQARSALVRDPLNAAAVHALGMAAEARHPGSGLGLFTLAERVSRRDLPNELALEAAAAAAGDTAGAVTHIDRLASVSPSFATVLLPPVIPALDDPAIAGAFMARASRPWFPALIDTAIHNHGPAYRIAAMIRATVPYQPPATSAGLRQSLVDRLIGDADFAGAAAMVAAMAPADRAALAALGFSASTTDPGLAPLSWQLTDDSRATAQLAEGGSLEVTIAPDYRAAVATRLTLLGPGRYSVNQRLSFDPAAPPAGLTWDVACFGAANQSLAHQLLATAFGRIAPAPPPLLSWAFSVPAGCPAQRWTLTALGATDQQPSLARLGAVALESR